MPWIVHKTSTLLYSFSFATQNLVLWLLLLNLLWSIKRVQKIFLFCEINEECLFVIQKDEECGIRYTQKKDMALLFMLLYLCSVHFSIKFNF